MSALTRRTVVVGGGLAGLAAARELAATGRDVVVLEGSPRIGGKLLTGEVAGIAVDVGAESMLARRPEGIELARGLGLEVVHPATTSSSVWTRGELRPLPRSVMGVPGDLAQVADSGVLSDTGLDRLRAEQPGPAVDDADDVSVGELVASRLGDEVVDRLVEPLLGGVYAGHARNLSARATVPQLVAWSGGSLVAAAASALAASDGSAVFAGIPGGLGRVPGTLASGLDVRLDAPVRALHRAPDGFLLVVGPTTAPEEVRADEVVLATPAAPAARLLRDLLPHAAAELAGVEYASMAVVSLAFRAVDLPELSGSGFLVPPVDGRTIKASTFSFNKWDWVRAAGGEVLVLRTSVGRHREESVLQVPDDELVSASLRDLGEAVGLGATPIDTHVQRWGGGLPQYAVGHLDRVARIRSEVGRIPGLAVCGAAYDGVGIPAVIASAHRAVVALTRAQ
ncbi:protoporphyrinogen oxidase [Nocardioides agariphilus]|uniref:Coproporphyrinogen III oxidase n=1 Tax=Nocardioides agariphilus TaxID=433664 RepID=A0A930VR59_9ACTN|nr:protoporphyrinogen oxidase [Nocardioides agariphilus]MBF4770311.1 protoporphyrinogen oxidase [Nocardioides agariphilus]